MLSEQQLHLSGDGVWAEMAQFVVRDEAAHEKRWRSMWAKMGLVVFRFQRSPLGCVFVVCSFSETFWLLEMSLTLLRLPSVGNEPESKSTCLNFLFKTRLKDCGLSFLFSKGFHF